MFKVTKIYKVSKYRNIIRVITIGSVFKLTHNGLWVEQSVFKASNFWGFKHLCGGLHFSEKSCYKSMSSAGFLMF